ncbi:MAG: sensor histidine kinase [Acidobacteria bacterium]|nr:sensor histidine kinase [Acidobacteriota bacterium]
MELAIHHAGVPLALFVLMQEFRFLLLDAFLRFLANFLLAALFTWAAAEAALHLGLVDYRRMLNPQVALLAAGSTALLVAFAMTRSAAQNLLTRLLFRRGDADLLLRDLRKHTIDSEAGYLEWAAERIAHFFEAERAGDTVAQDRPLPFDLGRRAGGRPYLSEDLALLTRLHNTVDERLEHYREAELKRLITQAELRALESRIHPHFLFNALNVLYGSIPKSAAEARRTVLNLSDIFRYFLQSGRSTIPLESEMQIVRAYLEIESLRLGPKLHTQIDIGADAAHAPIPVLSIQPLVENAVKHGIASLPEGGTVHVSAHWQDGRLAVSVTDSGPGFSPQPRPGLHVGLDNVRQRLRLCYGDSATLDIHRSGGLTQVGFTIPGDEP